MSEWQPIETAPKDGRLVLVYGGKSVHDRKDGLSGRFECDCRTVVMACWVPDGEWEGLADNWTHYPTHWMPVPKPPEST